MTASFFAKSDFLASDVFKPFADLDGKAAAAFLVAHGVQNVTYKDLGTNGLATGTLDGKAVTLSTNGFLSVKA